MQESLLLLHFERIQLDACTLPPLQSLCTFHGYSNTSRDLSLHSCLFSFLTHWNLNKMADILQAIILTQSKYKWCEHEVFIEEHALNTLRPRQYGRRFADDVFKCIFSNENIWISLKILLKFVPKVPINNIPALIQILAWRRSGDKPLSEPMMVSLLTLICVTRPQCLKGIVRDAAAILIHWDLVAHSHCWWNGGNFSFFFSLFLSWRKWFTSLIRNTYLNYLDFVLL